MRQIDPKGFEKRKTQRESKTFVASKNAGRQIKQAEQEQNKNKSKLR